MKRIGLMLLAVLLLLPLFCVPIQGQLLPNDPLVASVYEQIWAHLGVDTPGAAVAVMQNGTLLLREGFGYADLEERVLVTPETSFELGRLSGVFVALAVYQLADAGKLDPNADIADYLPADLMGELSLAYPISLEQLLLGCAGFEGRTFDLRFDKDSHRFDSLEQALLAQIPQQVYRPGSGIVSYSAFGIALAAYTVSCISGMPYEAYVTENILKPLAMHATVLSPADDTPLASAAIGYTCSEAGVFAAGVNGGRSYAGLYPADGALSTAADMSTLLGFLLYGNSAVMSEQQRQLALGTVCENGIFPISTPVLGIQGKAQGITDSTSYFGASLWIDPAASLGMIMLTNVARSDLLCLPAALCGAQMGLPAMPTEQLPELKVFEGVYAPLSGEGSSFVGRLLRREQAVRVKAADNGELIFGEIHLRQLAPGVFLPVGDGEELAQLQFLLDENGKVTAVVTASGESYMPLSFWQQKTVQTLLLFLLLAFCVCFLLAGPLSLWHFLALRREDRRPSFIFTLPLLFASLMAACVAAQLLGAFAWGAAAFSSFFGAMAVLTLLCGIGATGGLLLSFAASLTYRRMPGRVARTSLLFIAFLLLVHYWGLSVL